MKPIEFKESNVIYAKDQPEYLPLSAHKDNEGMVTTAWKLNCWERIKVLFIGIIYFQSLTFNQPLQPQLPSVFNPIKKAGNHTS